MSCEEKKPLRQRIDKLRCQSMCRMLIDCFGR